MNRNGIELGEIEDFITSLLARGLELVGVFSHNGYGDDIDEAFTHTQERFADIKECVKVLAIKYGFALPRFNGFGPLGIALYGYLDVAFSNPISPHLRKVAALYADRVSTRTLDAGARIGYSGCTTLEYPSRISTYDFLPC